MFIELNYFFICFFVIVKWFGNLGDEVIIKVSLY